MLLHLQYAGIRINTQVVFAIPYMSNSVASLLETTVLISVTVSSYSITNSGMFFTCI